MGIIYIQITRGDQNPREHKYPDKLKLILLYTQLIKTLNI